MQLPRKQVLDRHTSVSVLENFFSVYCLSLSHNCRSWEMSKGKTLMWVHRSGVWDLAQLLVKGLCCFITWWWAEEQEGSCRADTTGRLASLYKDLLSWLLREPTRVGPSMPKRLSTCLHQGPRFIMSFAWNNLCSNKSRCHIRQMWRGDDEEDWIQLDPALNPNAEELKISETHSEQTQAICPWKNQSLDSVTRNTVITAHKFR